MRLYWDLRNTSVVSCFAPKCCRRCAEKEQTWAASKHIFSSLAIVQTQLKAQATLACNSIRAEEVEVPSVLLYYEVFASFHEQPQQASMVTVWVVPLEVVFLYSLLHGASSSIKRAWLSVWTTSISISKDPQSTVTARLLLAFLQACNVPTLDTETSYQPCTTDYLDGKWQQSTGLTELPSHSYHCVYNGSPSRWLSVSAAYSTFSSSSMKELLSSSVITFIQLIIEMYCTPSSPAPLHTKHQPVFLICR